MDHGWTYRQMLSNDIGRLIKKAVIWIGTIRVHFKIMKKLRNKWRKNYMTCYKTDISREFLRIKINCRTFTVLESSSNLARIKCYLISTLSDAQNSNYFSTDMMISRNIGITDLRSLLLFVYPAPFQFHIFWCTAFTGMNLAQFGLGFVIKLRFLRFKIVYETSY